MKRILPILFQWLLAGMAMEGGPGPNLFPWEMGYPYIRNFTPRAYGADAQNWAVLQDARGVVYAGNNRGVLAYDGARWRLIPTTRRTVVRSLGMDETGRVYVGGVGEIGFIGADARGESEFVSLIDKLPAEARAFSSVWVTHNTSRGMFFQTREFLFLIKGPQVQVVKASSSFHLAFVVGERIFVRQRDVGLQEWKGEGLVMVPGGERFAQESLFTMLPLGGLSGKDEGGILVGSRRIGLWRLDSMGLRRFPTSADDYLKDQGLYSGGQLKQGSLALATIKGGVVLLDGEGNLQDILDRKSGLQSDNVKALCSDRHSGVWLALDSGISRVEWPSPYSIFDERRGLMGSAWAIQRFQGRMYVGTGQGAFVLGLPGPSNLSPHFKPLPGVSTQCLSFLPLEDRLLLASSQGTFEIRDGLAHLVRPASSSTLSFHRSSTDPSRIFIGMQGGLALVEHPQGSNIWRERGWIPGVTDDIYSMTEDSQGRLWLGTGSSTGPVRITFPTDWNGDASATTLRVERFPAVEGLSIPLQTRILQWKGAILIATESGVLRFDEAISRFVVEPHFAALFPEGPRSVKAMQPDASGRIWMDTLDEPHGVHETGAAVPTPGGGLQWEATPYRRFSESPVEVIQVEPTGVAWFGGPAGVVRYDPALAPVPGGSDRVMIRRVLKNGSLVFGGDRPLSENNGEEPVFPFLKGALRFEFALPTFELESSSQYQVRLDGYDHDWSPWFDEAQKEYTNLPGGEYCFKVRGRDIYGKVSPEQGFYFRVLPPWYRTAWAYLLFLGMAGLTLAAGVRLRTRLLQNRNLMLQHRIDLATEALRDRERLLASQAGDLSRANAQLLELNEQKNRFLGIVAHDLRNPLTSILLTTQLIQEGEEEDVSFIRGQVGKIAREGSEMVSLIGRFLDISALDSEGIRPEPARFSLSELVEKLRDRHDRSAQAKGITIALEVTTAEIWAFADPKFISAVLDNLISNAIKFTPLKSIVTIRAWKTDDSVRIAIQDQGPGLTEADQKKLFGRFSKLSAQPTGGEKSVGLGLSIAKQMVEICKGRIWVESVAGEGATFMVELPGLEA
jgi:signal transduction histidine kinase